MFTSLRGRSVIVTGSSKGIGRGIALRFGLAGCKVLVVRASCAEAQAVAAEIVAAGGEARAFAARRDAASGYGRPWLRAAIDAFGGIDILCANAGIFPAARLGAHDGSRFRRVIGTNLKGPSWRSRPACRR